MSILFIISLCVAILYIGMQIVAYNGICKQEPKPADPVHWPSIAILVAARNEALTISTCLQSLDELQYPSDCLQVLIGDDQSTDNTAAIVQNCIQNKPNFRYHYISENIGMAKGKANVLAQLAQLTDAEYLLITDADIVVKPEWAASMVSHALEGSDLISGFTVVQGKHFFERMQHLDWLYFMGLLMGLSKFGLHTTAVGNNMLVRTSAYRAVGGYENIPFSVTEDYALYNVFLHNGFICKSTMDTRCMNISQAQHTLEALLHQRKRWLTGAAQMPKYWRFLFLVFGSFIPATCVLLFYSPLLACLFIVAKWFIQFATIRFLATHFKRVHSKTDYVWYECYLNFISLLTAIYGLIPTGVRWKNRTY